MVLRNTFSRAWRRLALALVVLIAMVSLQPWIWRNVQVAAQELQDRRTQEEQLSTVKRQLQDMQSGLAQYQSLVDQTAVSFPSEEAAPQIIERLEQLAEQRGLRITVTSIQQKDDRSGMVLMTVSASVTGSVVALLEYLDRMEHAQEVTIVQGWGLQPFQAEGVNSGSLYQMNFIVDFYLQKNSNGKK